MLIASRLERWLGRPNLFVACILSLLVQDLVFIVVPNAIAVGVALALTGAVTGSFNVIFGSLRQRIVPNHLLGRVMASFRIISWGSLPLGALLGGLIGQTFGLTAVFIAAAVIHGLLLPSRLVLNDRFMAEVEEQARPNVAAQIQV
jgi:MFS family permease